jgi:Cysteine rich repeat
MTARIAITSSLFLGVAMLLLPSSMASAEVTGACLSDAKKLCPGVQPGGGKIRDCLKTHVKDLSDDCKAVLLKAVNVKACADDVKKHCADVQAGEGRLEACMKSHVADVSDACKVAMANAAAGDD